MDDLLSRVAVDPLSIAFPGRQTLTAAQDAGLTATDIRNGLNQTAIRVTALEGAPAGGGAFVAEVGIPVDGDNTYSAGPAGTQPVAAVVMRGGVVVLFLRRPGGGVASFVSSVADATAFTYFSQNAGAIGGFSFVNGGIVIEHSIAVPAAGEYWLPSGVTTDVVLFY